MDLKSCVFKISAILLFLAAAAGYVLYPEEDGNTAVFRITGERIDNSGSGVAEDGGKISGNVTDEPAAVTQPADEPAAVTQPADEPAKVSQPAVETVEKNNGESQSSGLININTAGAYELTMLPGIGPAKADAVIAYREEHGGFKTKEEIMNVPGIKDGIFSKIEGLICIE